MTSPTDLGNVTAGRPESQRGKAPWRTDDSTTSFTEEEILLLLPFYPEHGVRVTCLEMKKAIVVIIIALFNTSPENWAYKGA